MSDHNNQSTYRQNRKQTINGWKWAFILLVTILFSFCIYLKINTRPTVVNESITTPVTTSDEEIELSMSLDKKDMEQIINTYLEASMGTEFENYKVALTEQLEIHGSVDILTLEIPFSLYLDPYVTEEGNVQLRGKNVGLGNFSLPVNRVMSLIANQLGIPEFIAIDSEQQIMTIYLNELSDGYGFGFEMTKIDLEADEIELKLHVNKSIITDQNQNVVGNE